MSESKYSQNDGLDDKSLSNVILSVLRHKKMSGFFKEPHNHDRQSRLEKSTIQLSNHINKYLLIQSIIWFLRTGNRIQSKTL